MAIGAIFEAPNVTKAQYEQVRAQVMPDNRPAQGMIYHSAGPLENGGWCVFEVWESHEAADRFFKEKLGQALQQAKINVQPRFFEVQNTVERSPVRR